MKPLASECKTNTADAPYIFADVRDMMWEDGIGGVEAALHELGVGFCEGQDGWSGRKGWKRGGSVKAWHPQ